jgi:ribosomal protein S18 acetylase RimI-like enzyme
VLLIRCVAALSTRSATPADLAAVLSLWRATGGAASVTDTPEGLALLVRRDRDGLLIAERDGVVVGALIAAWDGWRGNFYRLAVLPERRREGIASALLREGERRLRRLGAVRLAAIVDDHDAGAMGFWQAAGYRQQGDRTRFVRERAR